MFLAELDRWWGEVDVNLMVDDHSIVPPRRAGQERWNRGGGVAANCQQSGKK
jgi:hypothetical protein